MTKKIYYIFTLIGSLLLSSCDSYLDIQPVGQVIPNTLAEYRALFTTAYNTALNDRGICEIRTDIATILQSDATSKNSLGDVEKWNDVNPNASTRQFGWAAYYTNIYYANAIIDKKDEISEENLELKVCKVNVDEASELAIKYDVESIPTLIYFKKKQ